MHEDDTLSRFERSEPFTGRIEPLDGYVLVEPVDDETETNAGLIVPASPPSMSPARSSSPASSSPSGARAHNPSDKPMPATFQGRADEEDSHAWMRRGAEGPPALTRRHV